MLADGVSLGGNEEDWALDVEPTGAAAVDVAAAAPGSALGVEQAAIASSSTAPVTTDVVAGPGRPTRFRGGRRGTGTGPVWLGSGHLPGSADDVAVV